MIWTVHFAYDNVGWPSFERAAQMINDTGMFSRNERFKKMSRLLGLESKLRFLLVFVFVFQHSIPVFYYYYFSCFHFKYSTYSSLAFLASTSAYQTECKCWRAKFSARGGRVGKRILADKPLMCTFSFPLLPPVSSFSALTTAFGLCSHGNPCSSG